MLIKLVLLIVVAFAVGAPFLRSEGHVIPRGGNALISVAFGLALLALMTALSWYFRIGPGRGLLLLAAAAFSLALLDGRGRRLRGQIAPVDRGVAFPSGIASALLMIAYAFPIVFAALWMGSGQAPAVFFNNDTPFYLGHVHALARLDAFPPASLNVLGVVQPYHYGVQLCAALFSRWATVAPHTALFWIVTPLFLMAKLAVVWRLATLAARKGVPHWLAVLVLIFFVEYPTYAVNLPKLFHEPADAWRRIMEVFFSVERFDTGFPLLSTLAGSFLIYLAALFMLDGSLPNRLAGLALAVVCLPLFKIPYIVPAGIWIGGWAIYQLAGDRRLQPLVAAACGGLLAFALLQLTLKPGFSYTVDLMPSSIDEAWLESFIWRGAVPYACLVLTAGACLMLLWSPAEGRRVPAGRAESLVFIAATAAIIVLPLIIPVTYVDPKGETQITFQTLQWLPPAQWIAAIAITLAAGAAFSRLSEARQAVFAALIVALAALPVAGKIRDAVEVVTAPAAWHEFVDNGPIIRALSPIPVRGTVIATNDLRYPANNYAREHRQLQIASLFGHQAYAAGTRLDHAVDGDVRVKEQELLRLPDWTETLSAIACQRGWTHVLINKAAPHVRSVPGKVLYDGDQYTSVKLPLCPR